MLKAVIFDLDGVIIDSEPIHLMLERELFDQMGLPVSQAEHLSYMGTTSGALWADLRDKYGLEQTAEELSELTRRRYLDYLSRQESIRPIPGAAELVRELSGRGVRLAVASSAQRRAIEITLLGVELKEYFPVIVSGDEVPRSKPFPDIFLAAAERLRVPAAESLVIEDSRNGVAAAKAAGMACLGFQSGNSGYQDLSRADAVTDSLLKIRYQYLLELYLSAAPRAGA